MSGKQVRKSIGSICGVDNIGPSTIELITALGRCVCAGTAGNNARRLPANYLYMPFVNSS